MDIVVEPLETTEEEKVVEPGTAVGFPMVNWDVPMEEDIVGEDVVFEDIVEGEWKDIPMSKKERLLAEMKAWAKAHGYAEPTTYEEAKEYKKQKDIRKRFLEEQAETSMEEIKARRRKYRGEHRLAPKIVKGVLKAIKPRPRTDLAKIFFPGKAMRELYIPKPPVKTTTEQIKEIREVSMPAVGPESAIGSAHTTSFEKLQRAGSPPPAARITTPSRDPLEFEGLGSALVRLRGMGQFPRIDRAVMDEVKANGDIDTPSHVRNEVSRLGFSTKEVDKSLRRLRSLGFLLPTGRRFNGEDELMLSGGSHG